MRVYVQDVSQAGSLISRAGWIDQPIQIVSLGMEDEDAAEMAGPPQLSDAARHARLMSLVDKPTLTRSEQIFVLKAMNDGIEI